MGVRLQSKQGREWHAIPQVYYWYRNVNAESKRSLVKIADKRNQLVVLLMLRLFYLVDMRLRWRNVFLDEIKLLDASLLWIFPKGSYFS